MDGSMLMPDNEKILLPIMDNPTFGKSELNLKDGNPSSGINLHTQPQAVQISVRTLENSRKIENEPRRKHRFPTFFKPDNTSIQVQNPICYSKTSARCQSKNAASPDFKIKPCECRISHQKQSSAMNTPKIAIKDMAATPIDPISRHSPRLPVSPISKLSKRNQRPIPLRSTVIIVDRNGNLIDPPNKAPPVFGDQNTFKDLDRSNHLRQPISIELDSPAQSFGRIGIGADQSFGSSLVEDRQTVTYDDSSLPVIGEQ
jgi:hypothetical protein